MKKIYIKKVKKLGAIKLPETGLGAAIKKRCRQKTWIFFVMQLQKDM